MDSRDRYVLEILYVETKEPGPLGGHAPGTPPIDPPMTCEVVPKFIADHVK